TGIGAALCYAALTRRRGGPSWPVGILTLGTLALLGSNVPMTALGGTDPREWAAAGWMPRIAPRMIYGAATYAPRDQPRRPPPPPSTNSAEPVGATLRALASPCGSRGVHGRGEEVVELF